MGYERKIDLMDPSVMALEREIEERRREKHWENYRDALKQRAKVRPTNREIIDFVVKEMANTL